MWIKSRDSHLKVKCEENTTQSSQKKTNYKTTTQSGTTSADTGGRSFRLVSTTFYVGPFTNITQNNFLLSYQAILFF